MQRVLMDLLFVRGSVWSTGRSVKNVHIQGLTFIQLLHSHLVHIPLLRVQLSWGLQGQFGRCAVEE